VNVDVLVVGAGFAGSVIAERCAAAGHKVLLIDKREHIAGNAYDELDSSGLLIHRYGPHIFHTNAPVVSDYLSRFTAWRPYEHKVLASLNEKLYPIPINQTTINRLYGLSLDEAGVAAFLERVREPRNPIRTSEDVVLSSVGRDLCDKFFRGYTRKQWGLDLSELSATVAARGSRFEPIPMTATSLIPSRRCPQTVITSMFVRMLDHRSLIQHRTRRQTSKSYVIATEWKLLFYTGPIDEYFDFRFGALPYRSTPF
jgi:UDP-galactopyranose mutase